MSNNLYEIKNISKIYGHGRGATQSLNSINLTIEEGKLTAILGPSGSGKSTLLNILGALDKPTSGHVLFLGEDISNYSNKKLSKFRRENIGFVFQSYNLLPNLTALENVEFSTEITGLPKENAENALKLLGLENRIKHYPTELSGGEQQRVSIARAIAKKPKVVLCDEPTGALDNKTGIMALKTLRDLNRDFGTSIVLITHSKEISKMADTVIKILNGEVVERFDIENPLNPEYIEW
jgi:putative ABC transport system ATP-binding protein